MPDRPDRPPSRWRRAGRVLAALACLGAPMLAVLALAGVWLRSARVDERFELGRQVTTLDPATSGMVQAGLELDVETAGGVLGVELGRSSWSFSGLPPSQFDSLAERRAKEDGWNFSHARTAELGTPDHPYLPFDRDRRTVGWTRTLSWSYRSRGGGPTLVGGGLSYATGRVVAPCWVWMLPWAVPPVWWLWCPPGRPVPRLTLRRSMAATALAAAILGAPAALYRSTTEERSLEALSEFRGWWEYGPDPAGSGRPVVTRVAFNSNEPGYATPDQDHLVAALRSFPALQYLAFGTNDRVATAEGFARLVEDHPALEELVVPADADDRSMAAIGRLRHLRKLNLYGSKVTDAGLARLAGHPTLEAITLGEPQATPAGLGSLHGLPRLKEVQMYFKEIPQPGGVVRRVSQVHLTRDELREGGDYGQGPAIDDAIRRLADSLPALRP